MPDEELVGEYNRQHPKKPVDIAKCVRFWINYTMPDGKQKREFCGYSFKVADAAMGKRKAQKFENPRILEKTAEEKMTFAELAAWYLGLKSVSKLKTLDRIKVCLANFNKSFGTTIVGRIKALDLEGYQGKREDEGAADATIDMELTYARAMVSKAFDNDMLSGYTLKAFRNTKRMLRKGANTRDRVLTAEEYLGLIEHAAPHLRSMLITAMNTGMRLGEIRGLRWEHVDREKGFIRLSADHTKESKPKRIPINPFVAKVLDSVPRALHHDFVFTFKGQPIQQRGGLKNSFKTACRKAGIPHGRKVPNGITIHDIRGTVKTNMMNAGLDKVFRDIILGHSLTGMDAHYMAPSEEDLKREMTRYTEWMVTIFLDQEPLANFS